MTSVLSSPLDLTALAKAVREGANAQYASPQFQRVLTMPLTLERAQLYTLQKTHWTNNRRDCWALTMGLAPMAVKKIIWEHERDELAGNDDRGVEDHFMLQVREAASIGLTLEDFLTTPIRDQTLTICYASNHLHKDSHWLKALAAVSGQELVNSSEWVDSGGGFSYRMGKKFEAELGIPYESQVNAKEHAEVDVDHAHIFMRVAREFATSERDLQMMLEGAREAWAIDRVWKGLLADMMAELPGPR
jgi:hypothetical protein